VKTEEQIRHAIAQLEQRIAGEDEAAAAYAARNDQAGVHATELVKRSLNQRKWALLWVLEA
jgi:hypothetical protein